MAKITNMRAIPPWEMKEATKEQYDKLRGREGKTKGQIPSLKLPPIKSFPERGYSDNENMVPRPPGIQGPGNGRIMQRPMPALPPREIEKRLKNLEVKPVASTTLVKKVGDQYQYDKDFVYIAYASALSNLAVGKITNQSDATSFQFTPYNSSGVLLPFRGYFTNKSIYQSGDPTDYTWESTDDLAGYNSVERKFTTSTGLVETLGTPTKPGAGVTWTTINAGSSIPATAIWYAERFTLASTTSNWSITAVGAYISSGQLVDSAVIASKIANNAITTAKILNDAIDSDKIASNAVLTDALAANAVTSTEIAANAVTTGKIVANAITATQIAANAITANEIQAGAIGVQELAANSVTANAIAANSVTASEIAAGTITASEIAADAITANAIATNAITADAITAGTITAAELASNSVTSAKVTADAITVDKMDLNGTLNVTAASGAIRWGKNDGDDITNSGLFIGRNSSSEPRFSIGTNSSFIWYDGDAVFLVGATVAANNGSIETIINAGNTPYVPSPTKSKVRIEMVGGGGGGGSISNWGSSQVGDGGDTVVKVQQWNSSTATWSDRGVSWTAGGGQGGISASTTRNGSGGSVGTVGSNSVVYQQSVDANNATINDKPGNGDGGAGAGISISTRTTSVFNGGGGAGGGDAGTTAYSTSSIAGSNGSVGGGGGGAKVYWGYGSNGGGGGSGGYLDILFTNISTTDRILVVSVGAGGSPSTSTGGNGGTGGAGRVRIIGVA